MASAIVDKELRFARQTVDGSVSWQCRAPKCKKAFESRQLLNEHRSASHPKLKEIPKQDDEEDDEEEEEKPEEEEEGEAEGAGEEEEKEKEDEEVSEAEEKENVPVGKAKNAKKNAAKTAAKNAAKDEKDVLRTPTPKTKANTKAKKPRRLGITPTQSTVKLMKRREGGDTIGERVAAVKRRKPKDPFTPMASEHGKKKKKANKKKKVEACED